MFIFVEHAIVCILGIVFGLFLCHKLEKKKVRFFYRGEEEATRKRKENEKRDERPKRVVVTRSYADELEQELRQKLKDHKLQID